MYNARVLHGGMFSRVMTAPSANRLSDDGVIREQSYSYTETKEQKTVVFSERVPRHDIIFRTLERESCAGSFRNNRKVANAEAPPTYGGDGPGIPKRGNLTCFAKT